MTLDQKTILHDLLAKDSGLMGWEIDFIKNMDRWFRDRDLTWKQAATLDRIAEKVL